MTIPGNELGGGTSWANVDASHATTASISILPPGTGKIIILRNVRASSDAASKLITLKTGASVAAAAQKGPTIPIGVETVISELQDYLCTSAGGDNSDNQAVVLTCTATAAARISCQFAYIDTPPMVAASNITATSA